MVDNFHEEVLLNRDASKPNLDEFSETFQKGGFISDPTNFSIQNKHFSLKGGYR